MAGKSALPLIIGVGAAALLLGGKKKKSAAPKKNGAAELERLDYLETTTDPGGDERMVFDEECSAIINKLNMDGHNTWVTNRYFQLLGEGMTDLNQVTVQLLMDQSEHCPWGEPAKWTPLMKGLYDQLSAAVKGWHEQTGGGGLPQG